MLSFRLDDLLFPCGSLYQLMHGARFEPLRMGLDFALPGAISSTDFIVYNMINRVESTQLSRENPSSKSYSIRFSLTSLYFLLYFRFTHARRTFELFSRNSCACCAAFFLLSFEELPKMERDSSLLLFSIE